MWSDNKAEVVYQLRQTRFIECQNNFFRACDFYAPFNEIFKVMQMSNLPKKWCKAEWEHFLILSGITNEVNPDLFVEIAKKLILEKDDIAEKSKVLMEHLLRNIDKFEYHFDQLKNIEFIVPEFREDLETILPHYRTTSGLICFYEALPDTFAEIAWTASTILPSYANIHRSYHIPYDKRDKKKEYCTSLGILSKPLPKVVRDHIMNISVLSNDMSLNHSKRNEIEKIMDSIYHNLEICEDDVIQNLQQEEVPLVYIPNHKTFVTPVNIIITLEEEIVPYIYSFPSVYGRYLTLFKEKFSVKQKANCEDYIRVLRMIYNVTQNEKHHPEELRSVKLAMNGLVSDVNLLEKISVTDLYLPSRNGIMLKSSDLYVADNKDLEEFIKDKESINLPLFLGFEKMGIPMDDVRFVRLLPESIRPKFLNDVLVEDFDDEIISETSGPLLEKIKRFLLMPEFIHSVLRIINHVKGKGLDKEDREMILQRLETVEVKQVKCINTNLFFNNDKIGSKSRSYFVKLIEENEMLQSILYLKTNCSKVDAKDGLSDIYKTILDISDPEILIILRAIFEHMKTPSHLESYLNRKNLKSYGNESLDFYIPVVGSYLDPELIDLLDNGFYSFHDEEIVAMEKYISEETEESRQDDTFIIVQVKCLVKENDEIMQSEYEVDIGEGSTIVVSASQLFKFVRKRNYNKSLGSSENSNSESENHASQLDSFDDSGFDDSGLECFVLNGSGISSYQTDPEENISEAEVMKIIKNQLIEIWKITDLTQRRQLVRRLQLKWHPDKNPPNKEELCTRCFQYIQSLIARLEKGQTIPDEEDYNTAPKGSPSYEYSNFFRKSNYDTSNDYHYNYQSRKSQKKRKMADPLEAQQWMKQAEHDFQAAKEELSQCGSSCWISYKCYEATKNSLIAALYMVDREMGKIYRNRADIKTIASALQNDGHNHTILVTAVSEMEDRVHMCGNLRQPTHIQLPYDRYQVADANFMISKAEIVVYTVKERF